MTKKTQDSKIITFQSKMKEINGNIFEVNKIKTEMSNKILESWRKAWIIKGGCDKCLGTGQIVVWDTMDSMSGCYAEYGACTNKDCTIDSRSMTGLDVTYRGKYHPSYNFSSGREDVLKPFLNGLNNQLDNLRNEELNLRIASKIEKGKVVIVTKGRKVPIGTIGKIFYMKSDNFGLTLGIKHVVDGKDQVFWVNETNVEVIKEDESDLSNFEFGSVKKQINK